MLTHKIFSLCALVFFSVAGVALSSHAAVATPDPTEQMKPFLKRVINTLSDPELKKLSKKDQCQRMVEIARERFDFREMTKRVLGPQWRNMDEKEQSNFEGLFTQLLQYAYIGKIEEYAGQQVDYVQQRIKDDRAEVQTLLVDKDKSIPVSYIMLLKGEEWMTYDVVVEGVSLIRNYMEQFRDILRNDNYSGLVKQVEDKIRELEKDSNHT